jgi:hypothetical protein
MNRHNLNNVICDPSRLFRNERGSIRKTKLLSSKQRVRTKNIRELYRGITEFKRGYQPRTNLAKDEMEDLFADYHNISNRWMNYSSQLLNIHGVNYVRQTEIYMIEPLVPQCSPLEDETVIKKLKMGKLPSTDLIPAHLIQVRCEILHSKVHKLINYDCNKEKLPK